MHSINFRLISRILGAMCFVEGATVLLPLGFALYYGEAVQPWLLTLLLFWLVALILFPFGRKLHKRQTSRREGMLTVSATWLLLSIIGALPFMLTGATSHFVDALFETISGFTTTGASVFDAVEPLSKALLLWRSFIQLQGGLGIVLVTLALFPIFGSGASQMYNAETTGISHDRFLPRVSDVAKWLWAVYLSELLVLTILLWAGPMNLYDALCHAMTCISTGGYSTKDNGINFWQSAYVEYVLAAFMFVGSLNMTLVYFFLKGQSQKLFKDEEFRWFTALICTTAAITVCWLLSRHTYDSFEETFRRSLFETLSLGSSTGFYMTDVTLWGPFYWMLALILMFINGCAGSTSGGLKTARFMVLIKNLYNEFKKQIHPHLLTPVLVNGKQLSISIVHQILAFCVLYVLLLFAGALLLMLDNNGFISSLSIACSAVSNSGPGIGTYACSVSSASAFTKLILCFLMIAGRLEVFTFIGILTPYFWKR